MWLEGQIVADLDNKQLVIYLGAYEILNKRTKKLERIVAAFMNEERFNNTPEEVSLDECLVNIQAAIIQGIPFIHDSFDKAKQAIKDACVAHAQWSRWGKEEKGEPDRVYGDYFDIIIVDDKVVFIKNEALSGKPVAEVAGVDDGD